MAKLFNFLFDEGENTSYENLKKEYKKPLERKSIQFWKTGMQKYRMTLEGEMQANSMNVKNIVENNYILHIKDIYENNILADIISYDKEMTECSNPAFKEMFTVTRQFEKLYDEFYALISLDGKIKEIKNLSFLQEKWKRIKNEMVPYFNEGTNIEEYFGLNDETMKKQDIWMNILNEQEILFLFFNLAGYGQSFNFSKTISRDNAYRSNTINWQIKTKAQQENNTGDRDIIQKIQGNFEPSDSWMDKAYGKMPFLEGVQFKPSYTIKAEYKFNAKTGFIKDAVVYMEEVAHPALVFHKMKFKITKIS